MKILNPDKITATEFHYPALKVSRISVLSSNLFLCVLKVIHKKNIKAPSDDRMKIPYSPYIA